jgi:leucyl aminopeptidase
MNTRLVFQDPAAMSTGLLAVFAVDVSQGKDAEPHPVLLTTSDAIANVAQKYLASGEFRGALCESLLLHAPAGIKADRLLIVGLGKSTKFSVNEVRKGAGCAVRAAKPRMIRDMAIAFPEDQALSDEHLASVPPGLTTRALVEGGELAEPDWDTYKSDRKDQSVWALHIVAREQERSTMDDISRGFEEGLTFARAQNFARGLVNEPGNVLTPTVLAQRAQWMAGEAGLACEVYSMPKLLELGMGAFAAVAQGSAEPPALIVVTYTPEGGAPEGWPVFGLVGKGITFDTGGISIKPAENMDKMKYDMAGAAAMLGAMRAIAELKPAHKVICVVCSAENMPDGKAFKPGDVVTTMSGKTIEIINTDAEGRLVLSDGLHYAKTLGCTHLVDAATLTGACVVALGYTNVGLFSNDDAVANQFLAQLGRSGEQFWRLPCTDDYKDGIKSNIADMVNAGSRAAGAINAALLLKEFVGETPWLHLDIAGCAWNEELKPWLPKGPTGVAVRSIVEWVRSY